MFIFPSVAVLNDWRPVWDHNAKQFSPFLRVSLGLAVLVHGFGASMFRNILEWSHHELANLGLLCRWFIKRVIIVYYNTLIPAQLNSLEKTAERIVENPAA